MNKFDANQEPRSTGVTGSLGYVLRPRQRLFNHMYAPPDGTPRHNCDYRQHACRIRDARRLSSALSLQQNGFELHEASSAVTDFYDERQVTGVYYREIETLAKALTGGMHAHVFDHQLRRLDEGRPISIFGRGGLRA